MDEVLVSALGNLPFAILLAYWIKLDFEQRKANMERMEVMVKEFTTTIRHCYETRETGTNDQSIHVSSTETAKPL